MEAVCDLTVLCLGGEQPSLRISLGDGVTKTISKSQLLLLPENRGRLVLILLFQLPPFLHLLSEEPVEGVGAKVIVTLGNRAVHSHREIPQADAVQAVKELFHFCYWFARLYARGKKPNAHLTFDESALPTTTIPKQTTISRTALAAVSDEQGDEVKETGAKRWHPDEIASSVYRQV